MTSDRRLGLDELMIVNPGPSGVGAVFLGEDGTLYQVQGLAEEDPSQRPTPFLLGEDGTLYRMEGLSGGDELSGLARLFLGEDGTVYQLQDLAAHDPAAAADTPLGGTGEGEAREPGGFFLGGDGLLYRTDA